MIMHLAASNVFQYKVPIIAETSPDVAILLQIWTTPMTS